MAILHEELYKNTNLSKIDFISYLQNLGSQISATIETNVTVTLTVEGSNVMLDILRAVPCGLIMNELISNSYKHAFRQQQLGQILINLSVDEDNVVIDYRDNGCGKTQERTGKFSLGTMLVTELSKQLRAIVEEKPQGIDSLIGAEPGYRIRIKFPIA
jgi:two-component sensor histidine kinase